MNSRYNLSTTTDSVNFHCTSNSPNSNEYSICDGSILLANAANSVNIKCGAHACENMEFNISNAITANFSLYSHVAARYAIIHANVQNKLTITCEDWYSCDDMKIFANEMTQQGSGVSLICGGIVSTCARTQLYCPQGDAYCTIDCGSIHSPCIFTTVFIEDKDYPNFSLDCTNTGCDQELSIQCMDTMLSTGYYRSDTSYGGYDFSVLQCENDDCCQPARQTLCYNNTRCLVCNVSVL